MLTLFIYLYQICVVEDIKPAAKKHFLVFATENKIPALSDLKAEDSDLMARLMLVASQIGNKECPNGYRLIINNGPDGLQTIPHLHIHILGGEKLRWP